MTAKCRCQNCNTPLEFDANDAGKPTACANCGQETILFIPPVQSLEKPKSAPVPQSPPKTAQNQAREYLESIRKDSCYGVLRLIINVCTVFAIAMSVVCGLGYIVENTGHGNENIVTSLSALAALFGAGLAILAIIGLRQSAFLLIDIADAILTQNAKKKD